MSSKIIVFYFYLFMIQDHFILIKKKSCEVMQQYVITCEQGIMQNNEDENKTRKKELSSQA